MKSKIVVSICYIILFLCFLGLYNMNQTEKKWNKMREEYKKDTIEVTVRDSKGNILVRF